MKPLEVALGDPHRGAEAVHRELAALDPPADCPGADVEDLGHFAEGEEFHRLAGFRLAWGHGSLRSMGTVVSAPAEGARS